jgi:hypothetical protein
MRDHFLLTNKIKEFNRQDILMRITEKMNVCDYIGVLKTLAIIE